MSDPTFGYPEIPKSAIEEYRRVIVDGCPEWSSDNRDERFNHALDFVMYGLPESVEVPWDEERDFWRAVEIMRQWAYDLLKATGRPYR